MASWFDLSSRFLGLTKVFNVMQDRQDRQAEDIKTLGEEADRLRDKMHDIDKRVAVLEEGRKTTAAEVKAALTETPAAWELAKMREDVQNEANSRRRLPKKDSGAS